MERDGLPKPGSQVQVRWDAQTVYTCTFLGVNQMYMYTLEPVMTGKRSHLIKKSHKELISVIKSVVTRRPSSSSSAPSLTQLRSKSTPSKRVKMDENNVRRDTSMNDDDHNPITLGSLMAAAVVQRKSRTTPISSSSSTSGRARKLSADDSDKTTSRPSTRPLTRNLTMTLRNSINNK